MFSFATENNSDSDEELDFTTVNRNTNTGLGNIFGKTDPGNSAANNSKLTYQAPKQPVRGEMRNVEIVQTEERIAGGGEAKEERLEVMSNVRAGVKMCTAVSAYKYENNAFESLGKLGLAIIGKKESSFYQLLLYRGKQTVVAVANISPKFNFKVQQDNYANFVDEGRKSWTVCFDSQDLLINFVKQVYLCKAMFNKDGVCSCDLVLGDGREVEMGDSLEVQMTSWMVDHQSLNRMIETTRNKDKGMRFKLGGRNFFSGLEDGIIGMKKGGRRFIIAPSESGRTAYDVEITKLKAVEQERRVPIDVIPTTTTNNNIIERMAKVGQPVISSRSNETPMEMPELEEVTTRSVSAFSTPRSVRRNSNHDSGLRTTPIPIIRSDSPSSSLRSGHSTNGPVRMVQQVPSGPVYNHGSEFNMLMSETRMQNTEMRMNIQRISDKMDTLIGASKQTSYPTLNTNTDDINGKLENILEQNREMKLLLEKHSGTKVRDETEEETLIKQQKLNEQTEMLRRLEVTLREKEQQLEKEMSSRQEIIQQLEERLVEQTLMTERSQRSQLQSEVKKLLGSTAKLLLAQFSEDEVYSGDSVRQTIGHTFQLIGDKLQEKYGSDGSQEARRDPPPVAAVAPVPAEVEEWEAESNEY